MALPSWLTPSLLARLDALSLSVRTVRAGAHLGGRYAVNRRGSSVEFAEHAPYHPGDDIRTIDWNLYARLDKLFIKTYREEIELSVEVIVDATRSMALPSPEKFARACQAALCLGYVALGGRHRVRMSWMQPGAITAGSWARRRSDVLRLAETLEGRTASGHAEPDEWVPRAAAQLRFRGGQAILITDGMARPARLFRALHLLRLRHMEVKLLQVLMPQELHPAKLFRGGWLVDAETGLTHQLGYSSQELEQAVLEHNEHLARFCKREGIAFARHLTDEPLSRLLFETLPARHFLE